MTNVLLFNELSGTFQTCRLELGCDDEYTVAELIRDADAAIHRVHGDVLWRRGVHTVCKGGVICEPAKTLDYYDLDHGSWIGTYCADLSLSSNSPLFGMIDVQTLTGKTHSVPIRSPSWTVADFKLELQGMTGTPTYQQRLIFGGRQLEDLHKLESILPSSLESTLTERVLVHLVLRLKGGGRAFADISKKPKHQEFSESAPDWRKVADGLNLEGKCTNQDCRANGRSVIARMGFKDGFHLVYDAYKCVCPMCSAQVVPVGCGFLNVDFRFSYMKIRSDGPPEKGSTAWREAGDQSYTVFRPAEVGMAEFSHMKIYLRRRHLGGSDAHPCGFCQNNDETAYDRIFKCGRGHELHHKCNEVLLGNCTRLINGCGLCSCCEI